MLNLIKTMKGDSIVKFVKRAVAGQGNQEMAGILFQVL